MRAMNPMLLGMWRLEHRRSSPPHLGVDLGDMFCLIEGRWCSGRGRRARATRQGAEVTLDQPLRVGRIEISDQRQHRVGRHRRAVHDRRDPTGQLLRR